MIISKHSLAKSLVYKKDMVSNESICCCWNHQGFSKKKSHALLWSVCRNSLTEMWIHVVENNLIFFTSRWQTQKCQLVDTHNDSWVDTFSSCSKTLRINGTMYGIRNTFLQWWIVHIYGNGVSILKYLHRTIVCSCNVVSLFKLARTFNAIFCSFSTVSCCYMCWFWKLKWARDIYREISLDACQRFWT